jgi:hypothetical protein
MPDSEDLREKLRMESANVESLAALNAAQEAEIERLRAELAATKAQLQASRKDLVDYFNRWRAATNTAADYKTALEEIRRVLRGVDQDEQR